MYCACRLENQSFHSICTLAGVIVLLEMEVLVEVLVEFDDKSLV